MWEWSSENEQKIDLQSKRILFGRRVEWVMAANLLQKHRNDGNKGPPARLTAELQPCSILWRPSVCTFLTLEISLPSSFPMNFLFNFPVVTAVTASEQPGCGSSPELPRAEPSQAPSAPPITCSTRPWDRDISSLGEHSFPVISWNYWRHFPLRLLMQRQQKSTG